jgi:hypothetical protein
MQEQCARYSVVVDIPFACRTLGVRLQQHDVMLYVPIGNGTAHTRALRQVICCGCDKRAETVFELFP